MAKKKNFPKDQVFEGEVIDSDLDKELKKLAKKPFINLTAQIETEYQLSLWYMKPKFDEWVRRLKLYNNQKRDKTAVGDPLLFTTHQTVLASLYDDRLNVSFEAREVGDEEVEENLNRLAVFDYSKMEKDIIDYEWDWDTLFFGRGLLLFQEFDRDLKIPIPEIIDPFTFLRDPRARSVNGDVRGRNAARFLGREMRMTRTEINRAGRFFNLDKLGKATNDFQSMIEDNIQARKDAQGFSNSKFQKDQLRGENQEFRLLEWYTYWRGKRVRVTLANERRTVIGMEEFKQGEWRIPIIDRAIYPMSHDWDGVSLPDIVEDKQRARALLQNLGLKSEKVKLNPTYVFNSNKIKNKNELNTGFNKYIPVDGDVSGAIESVNKQSISQSASFILEILETAAQRATATPDTKQGIDGKVSETATKTAELSRGSDVRFSLSQKIFGWSERRFWQQYYKLYKEHFAAQIDEKVLRINGALAPRWRVLSRENIIASIDPDVKIESALISETKRFNELQAYNNFLSLALSFPTSNKLFTIRKFGRLNGLSKEDIDQIIPLTADEIQAEEENIEMEENKLVKVNPIDDDIIHMEIHNKMVDKPAKYAHLKAHKRAIVFKQRNPEAIPQTPNSQALPEGLLEAGVKPVGGQGRGQGSGAQPVSQQGETQALPQGA